MRRDGMNMKFIILACLFLLTYLSQGFTLSEDIAVKSSNGTLYSQTHSGVADDSVQGVGTQQYYREYKSNADGFSLKSEYDLKNDLTENDRYRSKKVGSFKVASVIDSKNVEEIYLPYSPNRYSIIMKSPTGLQHSVSIRGWSGPGLRNLTTKNYITFTIPKLSAPASEVVNPEFKSDYTIEGAGDLSEDVSDFNVKKHPNRIAQTKISGSDFKLESIVSDTLNLFDNDATTAVAAMADVNITTEKGKEDPLKDAKSNFENGLLSAGTYVKILENDWKNGVIDDEVLLSEAKSHLTDKKITQNEYERLQKMVREAIITRSDVAANLSEITDKFQNGVIDKTTYLASIDNMWLKVDLSDEQYLGQLMKLKEQGKIDDADYNTRSKKVRDKTIIESKMDASDETATVEIVSNESSSTVNTGAEAAKEDPLSEIRSAFGKGLISRETYLIIIENNWKNGVIDDEVLLSETKSLLTDKKITQNEYDQLQKMVREAIITRLDVAANLSEITDKFQIGVIDKATYLELIDNMWLKVDLSDEQYLGQLMKLKEQGKIDDVDYNTRGKNVRNRIVDEMLGGRTSDKANSTNASAEVGKEGSI